MLTLTFDKPGSHMPEGCMRPILAVFFRHVRTQIANFLLVLQTVTNVVSHMLGIYVQYRALHSCSRNTDQHVCYFYSLLTLKEYPRG